MDIWGGQKRVGRRDGGTNEHDRRQNPTPRAVDPVIGHITTTPQTSTPIRTGSWEISDTVGQVEPLKLDKIKLTKEFIAL